MHTKTLIGLLWLSLITVPLTAQAQTEGEAQTGNADPRVLVRVGDAEVTDLHLALFAGQTSRRPSDAAGQLELLNELVNNVMVANSPEGRALETRPEVIAALEVSRSRLIAQAFVRSELEKVSIDDARVKAIYEAEYSAPSVEYKARHILLETEDEAKTVIASLDSGEDFAKLAETHSIGPSKTMGGDLGWFEPARMVPAFSTATAALDNGSYSKEPVKSDFGWHVILREDSREIPAPSLEDTRPEIEQQIRREQVAAALSRIQDNTRIEVQDQN